MPVRTPGPITERDRTPRRVSESSAQAEPERGHRERHRDGIDPRALEIAQVEQALQHRRQVVGRQLTLRGDTPALDEFAPSNRPSTVWVLPTSTASSAEEGRRLLRFRRHHEIGRQRGLTVRPRASAPRW